MRLISSNAKRKETSWAVKGRLLSNEMRRMTLWKIFAVDTQFKQLRKRSLKKFRLQRDSNPWPLRYRCSALPTELWSHNCWEQVNFSGSIMPLRVIQHNVTLLHEMYQVSFCLSFCNFFFFFLSTDQNYPTINSKFLVSSVTLKAIPGNQYLSLSQLFL